MTKSIIITGATRGIGRALVTQLVEIGHTVIDTEMPRSCWGDGAGACPTPARWAERAAPFFLSLSAEHNGQALSV